jgi:hypothetical protein
MRQMKLLLCHTNGLVEGIGPHFSRKGIYYPVVRETDATISITSEYAEVHVFSKFKDEEAYYRNWFQLVEVERAYFEV